MLTLSVHRLLATLFADVHQLITRIGEGATSEEVGLRASRARENLDALDAAIGGGSGGPFYTTARHLHFLVYYHERDKPDGYAQDLRDLVQHDLPGVAAAVETWSETLLDAGLTAAVRKSWAAGHYASAVRDAFIYLEELLRELSDVDPASGLSGEKLVSTAFSSTGGRQVTFGDAGPFGELTRGETVGVQHLIRGAFLLARNATAHRSIDHDEATAESIIHLVNLSVRLVRSAVVEPPTSHDP